MYQFVLPALSIVGVGILLRNLLIMVVEEPESNNYDKYLDTLLLGTLLVNLLLIILGLLLDDVFVLTARLLYITGLLSLLFNGIRYIKSGKVDLKTYRNWNSYQWALLGVMLTYVFYAFISPIRGWDSLQFYFPNARFYVESDGFSLGTNPLTFYPMFKPPLVSILFAYSFANVGEFYLELLPWFYMILIPYVTIKTARILYDDERVGYFAAVLMGTMVFSFHILLESYYFQEIPLTLFVSAAIYYYLQYRRTSLRYYLVMAEVAIVLSALTKLSGIILFPFMALIFRDFIHRYISALGVMVITLFLTYKSAVDIYIGTSVFVLAVGIYMTYSVLRREDHIPEISQRDQLLFLSPGIAGFVLGVIGFIYLAFTSGSLDFWTAYIFRGKTSSIRWEYPTVDNPAETIWFQYSAQTSFTAAIFFLFTGMIFVSAWILYKIWGAYSVEFTQPFLNRWIWIFFIIWLTYFSYRSSSRYLSFILVPLSIVTAKGIIDFGEYFKHRTGWEFDVSVLMWYNAILPFFYYYPTVPLEFVTLYHSLRLYYHHLYQFRLVLYAIAFLVIGIGVLKIADDYTKKGKGLRFNQVMAGLTVFMFVLPGILAYSVTGFSTYRIQTELFHHTRAEMNTLVEHLNSLGLDNDDLLISVDTAGVPYRTGIPTYDLIMPFLDKSMFDGVDPHDINEVLSTLQKNNLRYFLYPKAGQARYSWLDQKFGVSYWLSEPVFNSRIYSSEFNTSEYDVLQFNYNQSFSGLLSIGITDGKVNSSLMGYQEIDRVYSLNSNISLHFAGLDVEVNGSAVDRISFVVDNGETFNYSVAGTKDLYTFIPVTSLNSASSVTVIFSYGGIDMVVDQYSIRPGTIVLDSVYTINRGTGIFREP